jgi:hypothetical protein
MAEWMNYWQTEANVPPAVAHMASPATVRSAAGLVPKTTTDRVVRQEMAGRFLIPDGWGGRGGEIEMAVRLGSAYCSRYHQKRHPDIRISRLLNRAAFRFVWVRMGSNSVRLGPDSVRFRFSLLRLAFVFNNIFGSLGRFTFFAAPRLRDRPGRTLQDKAVPGRAMAWIGRGRRCVGDIRISKIVYA